MPLKEQTYPYDTTMLYDWLTLVGINKDQAQKLFEFEAVYNGFPGLNKSGGHKTPTKKQMLEHWENVLQTKVECADKIWLLGSVSKNFIESVPKTWSCNMEFLETIHPSRRNIGYFLKNKEQIIESISNFIYGH